MIKKFIILLILINLDKYLCVQSRVKYDISEENSKRFPWMVTILKSGSLVSYGTLIHSQAVLTSTTHLKPPDVGLFEVHANCYGTIRNVGNYTCSDSRRIKECTIVEVPENKYSINYPNEKNNALFILILSRPFGLNERINTIALSKNRWINLNYTNCIVLSLRNFYDDIDMTASFFAPFLLNISYHKSTTDYSSSYIIITRDNKTDYFIRTFDDLGRKELLINYHVNDVINLMGGPIVCKSSEKHHQWQQLAVSELTLKRTTLTRYLLEGSIIFIDNNLLISAINSIIKSSVFNI